MNYEFSEELWNLLDAFDQRSYVHGFLNAKHSPDPVGVLYLRHDIDFDCQIALSLAGEEAQRNILSSYYFLLRSDAYNLLSKENCQAVKAIKDMGHQVNLHFDPTLYDDPKAGLKYESELFKQTFGVEQNLVSIHRPPRSIIGEQSSSYGVGHSYEQRFMGQLAYCADSGGSFRYGKPTELSAFTEGRSVHLLLHPIWWLKTSKPKLQNLVNLAKQKQSAYWHFLEQNCLPLKSYRETGKSDNDQRT